MDNYYLDNRKEIIEKQKIYNDKNKIKISETKKLCYIKKKAQRILDSIKNKEDSIQPTDKEKELIITNENII